MVINTLPGGGTASSGAERYTRAEMNATSAITRAEDPRWRWMFPVTRRTRDFVTSQFPMLQLCYVMAVALIYFSARIDARVSPELVAVWLMESAISFVVRWSMCIYVAKAPPASIAAKPLLRLIPLFAIILGTLHWCWTGIIFIGPTLSLTTLVVLLSFVMLSVSIVGIAPASPAICLVYLVPLWSVTTHELMQTDWASAKTVLVMVSALTAVLWSAFYIVVSGVRRYLVRGDEVDLLVDELRDRNAEVEAMRSAAARDFATRTEFFASASHDFRQRVHAMKLLAQSAVTKRGRTFGDKSSLLRLGCVVEDLETYMTHVLEFARLESPSLKPRREVHRLQDLFQKIDVHFEDVAAARGVDLRLRTTTLRVRSDGVMLVRILENLVSNAVKFTRARVLVSARRQGKSIYLEVRDQGPGIPLERIEAVFEAFYQGPVAPEHAQGGVGLGLAIVRRLSEALGYRVEVHSRPGAGTLMRVIIPDGDAAGQGALS
jgi:signal transduction histidine kinase